MESMQNHAYYDPFPASSNVFVSLLLAHLSLSSLIYSIPQPKLLPSRRISTADFTTVREVKELIWPVDILIYNKVWIKTEQP